MAAKSSKKRKKLIIALVCILLALALIVGALFAVVGHYLGKINRDDPGLTIPPSEEFFETDVPPENTVTLQTTVGTLSPDGSTEATTEPVATEPPAVTVDPDEITWEELPAIGDDDILNIMLVGQDRRPGEGRTRSDVMMLCSINPKTGEVSLISFLRDLYVQIPGGYSDNRLNVAYFFGGFPLLYETMYQNFGITVDGGFEVDFEGFSDIVDTLGGVDVTLSGAEAKLVGVGESSGYYHLNGEQALTYSRIRSLDNDFNRTGRQRIVMEAIFNKFRGSDLSTVLSLIDTVLPMLTTDMSNTEIISLAPTLVPSMSNMEISTYMIPAYDCYTFASIRGMSVLLPDLPKIRNYLATEYLPLNR